MEIDRALLARWPLPDPNDGESKEDRGRVLIVGGSREIAGAALLAAHASLRSGAGKLHIAAPHDVAPALAIAMPEARVSGLVTTPRGEIASVSETVLRAARASDAVLIGPGMTGSMTTRQVAAALAAVARHAVLDAGAIGAAAGMRRERASQTSASGASTSASACTSAPASAAAAAAASATAPPAASATAPPAAFATASATAAMSTSATARAASPVITPHHGEMASLLGCSKDDIARDAESMAVRYARENGVVVVLKSAVTYVANPAGDVWVHRGGSIGLGTSGSGDVLAGVVTGLIAQGAEPDQAAVWGVALHGAAGAALSERIGLVGYLAREIADEIPRVRAAFEG